MPAVRGGHRMEKLIRLHPPQFAALPLTLRHPTPIHAPPTTHHTPTPHSPAHHGSPASYPDPLDGAGDAAGLRAGRRRLNQDLSSGSSALHRLTPHPPNLRWLSSHPLRSEAPPSLSVAVQISSKQLQQRKKKHKPKKKNQSGTWF